MVPTTFLLKFLIGIGIMFRIWSMNKIVEKPLTTFTEEVEHVQRKASFSVFFDQKVKISVYNTNWTKMR